VYCDNACTTQQELGILHMLRHQEDPHLSTLVEDREVVRMEMGLMVAVGRDVPLLMEQAMEATDQVTDRMAACNQDFGEEWEPEASLATCLAEALARLTAHPMDTVPPEHLVEVALVVLVEAVLVVLEALLQGRVLDLAQQGEDNELLFKQVRMLAYVHKHYQ